MLYEKVSVLLLNKIKNVIVLSVLQVCMPLMCETYLKQIF